MPCGTSVGPSPWPPPFPYTTLFRSGQGGAALQRRVVRDVPHQERTGRAARGASRREELDGLQTLRRGRSRHAAPAPRSEEHTSELQSQFHLVCRLPLSNKSILTASA